MRTIVTTAGRPDEQSEQLANFVSKALNIEYVLRNKRSIAKMKENYGANIIVAGKNRFEYFPLNGESTAPFFYHPNSAAYRLKRVARGENDPFLLACNLTEGDALLDCTLGLGSDALLASFVVGKLGKVIGLEADSNVAFIVQQGMQQYDTTDLPLTACMRDIQVIQSDAISYLKSCKDNCFDVVYMDPMFEEVIEEATNFGTLRQAGAHIRLSEEWVQEALRVAKKRVVLKAHFESPWFERFNFKRDLRLTSKFHFGILEKS